MPATPSDELAASPFSRLKQRALHLLAALALMAAWSAAFEARAAAYALQAQDKVRVKVVEWRSSLGEYYEWAPITGEYSVSPAGNVSLPLVGEIRAAGLTTKQLADAVSASLQARVGLVSPPEASVEIVQYRPFYIVGAVDKPGEYQYRPGLTVLQAVSIAGGYPRLTDSTTWPLARDAIVTRGDMRTLALTIVGLNARRTRLTAEWERREAVQFPPELQQQKDDPFVSQLMREEQLIFAVRRDALAAQLSALARQDILLKKEVETLQERIATEDKQLKLIQKELEKVSSLLERGLVRSAQQLSLERAVSQVQGDILELQTAMIRAQQESNKIERNVAELQSQRRTEILNDLTQTRAKIEELTAKLGTTERLNYETEMVTPQLQADAARDQDAQTIFSIVRRDGERTVETVVLETAAVEPGDLIKVQRPLAIPPRVGIARDPGGEKAPASLAAQTPAQARRSVD